MIHILTPTLPKFQDDVETRRKLLEVYVPEKLGKGLELIMPLGMVNSMENFKGFKDKSVENLKPYLDNHTIVVHMPLQRDDFTDKCTDLSEKEGLVSLKKAVELAEATKSKKVVAHPEVFIYGDDESYKEEGYREEKMKAIKENLAKVVSGTDIEVMVENMSLPLMGDIKEFSDASTMPYNAIANTLEDCMDFDAVTIDTCHYNITRRKINSLLRKYGKKLSSEICEEEGIKGVYPGTFGEQPDLSGAFEQLSSKVKHIHFSDSKGIWAPNRTIFYEGVVPGDGEIGEEVIRKTLEYIQSSYDSMTITVEVNDKDFKNPVESIESLKRIVDWLK